MNLNFARRFARPIITTLSLAGCLVALGCGADDGLEKRYPVSGTVTYKGQALAKGGIMFLPDKPEGKPANGVIENGSFKLTTLSPDDGAFTGTYKVTVDAITVDYTEAEAKAKAKGSTSQFIPQDMQAEAQRKAKNAVPAKYSQPATSGLTAEVKTSGNSFKFDLVD